MNANARGANNRWSARVSVPRCAVALMMGLSGSTGWAQDVITPEATTWYPGSGSTALLAFEDQWPDLTDFDYNDVILEVHWVLHSSGGLVYRALLTVDPQALGGEYANGLGVQLPAGVSKDGLVVERRLGTGGDPTTDPTYGPWTELTLSADAAPTVVVSSNLRELFANESGRLNVGVTNKNGRSAQRLEVEFNWPAGTTLDASQAPFDVYIFRTQTPSTEIHLPTYRGTAAMNTSLFTVAGNPVPPAGTRWFTNSRSIPAALNLQTATQYPLEAVAIDLVYPQILQFASSGGTQATTFYSDASGLGGRQLKVATRRRPTPRAITRTQCSPGANQLGRRVGASSACAFTGCEIGYALSGGTCVVASPCSLPWGSTISHGQSVTAYQAGSGPCGQTCASQVRTCAQGVLSGSYTLQTCTAAACTPCTSIGQVNQGGVCAQTGANALIAAISDLGGGASNFSPYASCAQALGAGWYTPNRAELQTLYANRTTIGGFSAGYWSSENNALGGYSWRYWALNFGPNIWYVNPGEWYDQHEAFGAKLRCVRRAL
jgi:LruC domain-containing protein